MYIIYKDAAKRMYAKISKTDYRMNIYKVYLTILIKINWQSICIYIRMCVF